MSDCKRCGGTGKVGMAVANPFGSHDYEWDDCPEYHPDGNTRLKIENASLHAEVERLKKAVDEITAYLEPITKTPADCAPWGVDVARVVMGILRKAATE